jgi:protein-disulfide isomerase
MRKALFLSILSVFCALSASADDATKARVARYFTQWYSVCPGTKVTVTAMPEVVIPGYDAYRAERGCDLKNRNESGITLVDKAGKEIFVGQVLHDDTRHDRPFVAATDLPVFRGALQDMYGLPVNLALGQGQHGSLVPLVVRILEAPNAVASVGGFASPDGASILVGEFFPLDVEPNVTRAKLLAAPGPPAPAKKSIFSVTAFIDFQCERCRVRTPQVRTFAWAHGGEVQVRFLPLVKIHNWAFAAAECAAALTAVSPPLYAKYEDAIFPRAGDMNETSVRDVANDVAQAAGVGDAYVAELSSGRARRRVLDDIELALRLGLNGTPVFFYRGAWLTSEPELAENYVQKELEEAAKPAGKGAAR